MNQQDLIQQLGLTEHVEGGYFRETYRAKEVYSTNRVGTERAALTSIYYLLTSDRPIDHFHRNQSDIMHYFQLGSSITYLLIDPEGNFSRVKLGTDFAAGETAQLLVPGNYWKAAVLESGDFGLIGEAVSPGFDYRDMQIATPELFQTEFPELWEQCRDYIQINK